MNCTCPRIDGYRIKRNTCPVHAESDAATMKPHEVTVIPTRVGPVHVCVTCGEHTMRQAPALPCLGSQLTEQEAER